MDDRTFWHFRRALHDLGGSLVMTREYLADAEKILQAGSYPEYQQKLGKVQEAMEKCREEVAEFGEVCKSEIPEPDSPGTEETGREGL